MRYPETPRTRAKQWILAGRVSVAGVVIRKPHQVVPDPGDTLALGNRAVESLDCGPGWQIHGGVALLYLDSSLAIINKSPGLISVPAPNCEISALSILSDFLAGKFRAREPGPAGRTLPAVYRKLHPLPVHRLDQYTSGVLCIAMNPVARGRLIKQLRTHTMRREYIAFVQGCPSAPKGTWRGWLQLKESALTQRVVSQNRPAQRGSETREGITHFEVIEQYCNAEGAIVASKLRLTIETGLKHQIRVQAAYAGVPVIGDRSYNPAYGAQSTTEPRIPFARQALHADRLTLEHPEQSGQQMSWTASPPKDLAQLEATLRALFKQHTRA